MRKTLTAGLAMALLAAAPQAFAQDTTVTIDAGKPGATINRHIFGQFAEHLGTGIYGGVWVGPDSAIPNVRGIRTDVVEALRAIKVPNVRWPGGCFADEYHWQNGIGAPSARRATVNANWGGAIEPNTFGTDEFMDFVGQIGTEAFVSVNVGSGTFEEAADWLAYMTADQRSAAGARARRERPRRALQGQVPRHRQRELGLRRQHAARALCRPAQALRPLHPQLQSGPARRRRRRDAAHRGRAVGRRHRATPKRS